MRRRHGRTWWRFHCWTCSRRRLPFRAIGWCRRHKNPPVRFVIFNADLLTREKP